MRPFPPADCLPRVSRHAVRWAGPGAPRHASSSVVVLPLGDAKDSRADDDCVDGRLLALIV